MTLRQRFSLQRFLRGEGPEPGPIHLVQRRVYILPTKMGIYFASMLLVMLLGAVNYNNSLAYALTFLLASMFFIAILHTYRNLLHLRIDMGQAAPVFCGETAQLPVLLDNRNNAPRYAIRLQLAGQAHVTVDVPEDNWLQIKIPLRATQRGRHKVQRLRLEGSYPLGLFQAWAYAQRDVDYLVYPAPDEEHSFPSVPGYSETQQGDRGKGMDDFAGLRNYQSGDSLRQVHWKTVARGQGMHTKLFAGNQAVELWLDWSTLPQLDIEARLSRLARWVLDADAQGLAYGLRIPGLTIPLGSGGTHRHRCLEALALFETGKQENDSG